MNPELLDLALRKQRLQIRARLQRQDMAARLGALVMHSTRSTACAMPPVGCATTHRW